MLLIQRLFSCQTLRQSQQFLNPPSSVRDFLLDEAGSMLVGLWDMSCCWQVNAGPQISDDSVYIISLSVRRIGVCRQMRQCNRIKNETNNLEWHQTKLAELPELQRKIYVSLHCTKMMTIQNSREYLPW
jgi:hypothetical protein